MYIFMYIYIYIYLCIYLYIYIYIYILRTFQELKGFKKSKTIKGSSKFQVIVFELHKKIRASTRLCICED